MKHRAEQMEKRTSSFREMIKKRVRQARKKIRRKMHRMRHSFPHWLRKMGRSPRKRMMKRMRKMWYRKVLLKMCHEAQDVCGNMKCPKKITRCLMQKKEKVSSQCAGFLDDVQTFKRQKKEIKRTFKASKRQCKSLHKKHKARHECIHSAKKAKRASKKALRLGFKSKMEAAPQGGITVEKTKDEKL